MRSEGVVVPRVDLTLSVDVERTPRVAQVEGMFDVPIAQRRMVDFHLDVPFEERDWSIGLIVGPSGCGKTSVARHLFGDAIVSEYDWHPTMALVDSFDAKIDTRDVLAALSSVGFSSPPAWVKPYAVLSNGEKFRANMARALLDAREITVFDEFTSFVDRQVARVAAFSVGKAVRKMKRRFVAVTCHEDVEDWLLPDWTLKPHTATFDWGLQRRHPTVEIDVRRTSGDAWPWFAPHHYLTAHLKHGARCFVGFIDGRPAAFAALLHQMHPAYKRDRTPTQSLSRLVVHPDYQGLGIGSGAFVEAIGAICESNGYRMHTHPSHPALIGRWSKDSRWLMVTKPRIGTTKIGATAVRNSVPAHVFGRRISTFRWMGGAFSDQAQRDVARRMWMAE